VRSFVLFLSCVCACDLFLFEHIGSLVTEQRVKGALQLLMNRYG